MLYVTFFKYAVFAVSAVISAKGSMYRSPPQVQPAINICENSFDNGFVRLVERCDRHFPRKVENISIDSRDVDVVNDDTFSKIASSSTAVILGNVSTFDNN